MSIIISKYFLFYFLMRLREYRDILKLVKILFEIILALLTKIKITWKCVYSYISNISKWLYSYCLSETSTKNIWKWLYSLHLTKNTNKKYIWKWLYSFCLSETSTKHIWKWLYSYSLSETSTENIWKWLYSLHLTKNAKKKSYENKYNHIVSFSFI